MKKILVPTDFSPNAENALRFAAEFSEKTKGEIILFHVYIPHESPMIDSEDERRKYNIKMKRNLQKRLERLTGKMIALHPQLKISAQLGRSPLTNRILCFTADQNIDLIIMGTQGASGLRRVVIGTETVRIIENTFVPVLLVPEKSKNMQPRKIVFATAGKSPEIDAIGIILKFATAFEASVEIVHLQQTEGSNTYSESIRKEPNLADMPYQHIETDSIKETLENLGEKVPYEMLAMVRRKKTFLEKIFTASMTKDMAYITDHPMLVIPEDNEINLSEYCSRLEKDDVIYNKRG